MTNIRHASSTDVQQIYDLIHAIADHHGQSQYVKTNTRELLASGFGDDPSFGVLLAERENDIVGFVSFTINYSIWLGEQYMNIDDLYVDASSRGLGIGEQLMQESRNHCLRIGASRIRWEVQADNRSAIRFYERLGARMSEKGVFSWDISQ
jgi:ribosomal protein S18 acetylase RimI-like enzyme